MWSIDVQAVFFQIPTIFSVLPCFRPPLNSKIGLLKKEKRFSHTSNLLYFTHGNNMSKITCDFLMFKQFFFQFPTIFYLTIQVNLT